MKRGIISFMLISAIILSTVIATAMIPDTFGSGLGAGQWLGGGNMNMSGSALTATNAEVNFAQHAVSTNPSGAFKLDFTFKVVNTSSDVFAGVASSVGSSGVLLGWDANSKSFLAFDGSNTLATLGTTMADPNAQYSATISSTDGKTFTCSINGIGSKSVTGFVPTFVNVRIENGPAASGPQINSLSFSTTAASATPSASPSASVNPSATVKPAGATDYRDMQNWYANYYQPPTLSNQSVVYDQSGKIVKVVTGKPGEATTSPIGGQVVAPTVAPTVKPGNVSAGNVTAPIGQSNNTTVTVPPVATATPTKTQSPGFGIILAAMAMIGVLFYISRKK